ncbi:MAG: hypothetical protein ACRDK7_14425 [Solirubrobacteraceae bacterium]
MSGPAEPPAPGVAEQTIESYLAEIAARLDGPVNARREILAELGAGLADAADAHRYAGLDSTEATFAAIAEFGCPARVAAGFRGELAATTARRTALTLMTVGLLTSALGSIAALASHIHLPAPPWESSTLPAGAWLATLLATVAIAAAIGSHLYTLASAGRLTRWLPARPATSAAIAAGSAVLANAAMFTRLTIVAVATPRSLAVLPLAAVGAASLAWLVLAARGARTCLAIRATYPRIGAP